MIHALGRRLQLDLGGFRKAPALKLAVAHQRQYPRSRVFCHSGSGQCLIGFGQPRRKFLFLDLFTYFAQRCRQRCLVSGRTMRSFPVFDSASFHAPSPKLIKEAGLGPPRRRLASPANVIGALELMHVPLADDKITKMSLRIYFRSHSPRSHGTHGIRGGLESSTVIESPFCRTNILLRRKRAHPNALLPMLMSVPMSMSVANCRHGSSD